MPDGYTAVFVASTQRWETAEALIGRIVEAHGGELLSQEIAHHEWEERFNLMHVKRLGPSLLPSEVVVPIENLGAALSEIEKAVKQPLVMEGMVNGNGEVTLLGFIPHDERTLGYNMAFGLALTVIKIAKKYGGRPYATGYYFASEADAVLGTERVRKLKDFQRQVDPNGVMNPGKVTGNGLMGTFMGLAGTFEPIIRVMGNSFKSPTEERIPGQGKKGIPDDVAWYAYACAQCGYCVDECDQYYGRGWESESPRGKWFFLREFMEGRAKMTQEWVNKFLACTTCEVCNVKCPLELPIEPAWLDMRGELIHKQDRLTFPPFEIMRASLRKELNIWASYSKDRSDWVPKELEDKIRWRADIGYFPGCTASYVEPDVAQGTAQLLNAAGAEFTYMGDGEACCGLPMLVSGQWDTWEEILRHNVSGMKARGVKTVVTSCPACWLSWTHYYPQWAEKLGIEYDIESKHYTEIIAERIESGDMKFTHEVPMKVTWHDSCHMGRAGGSEGIYEPPRKVMEAIPGIEFVEMEHNRENAHCCGGVLSLLENPETAVVIGDVRLQEAVNTGAEALIASCPCCEVQLRVTADRTNCDLPIIDLAHLASDALGIDLPDPTEYALDLWGTFEAMIYLLKPEAMAGLMADLLPEMIDAMPGPFPAMMKWTKNTSPGVRNAMLAMMRPMMPRLFPILMPGMMPKVMPDMLVAVEKVVPMPPHMKEQMPDLMPEAMDNLLPKMLPLIIPHFMPMMEAYLNGEPINGQ
jgi:Fe-S oxidoreductase